MKNRLFLFVNIVILCVLNTVNAAIHDHENKLQPVNAGDLGDFTKSAGNLKIDGPVIYKIDNDYQSRRVYDRIAQNNVSEFTLSKQDIELVQRALNELGYNAGKVDGLAHIKTVNAIVDLQQAEGLPVTGEIDQQLLEFLKIK